MLTTANLDSGFASTRWQRQKEGTSLGELGLPERVQAVADRRVINHSYRVAPPTEPLLLSKRGRGEGGVGEIGTVSAEKLRDSKQKGPKKSRKENRRSIRKAT